MKQTYRKSHKQTNKQTNKQSNKQSHKQTDNLTKKQADRKSHISKTSVEESVNISKTKFPKSLKVRFDLSHVCPFPLQKTLFSLNVLFCLRYLCITIGIQDWEKSPTSDTFEFTMRNWSLAWLSQKYNFCLICWPKFVKTWIQLLV